MENCYKISVVIPLYNQDSNIETCISSLRRQTVRFDNLEIILVNDGCQDNSEAICEKLSKKYSSIIYISQENKGVSAARNQGIKKATGKYIFFLDADDILERHTIQNVSNFFDSVYDETDLVTYPIETIYKGKVTEPHFRYQVLKESGVYDFKTEPYIGQTTINIAVKNRFEENILFDETQTFSEDQKYCCEVLERTLKMGFCKDGKYIYHRSRASSSGQMSGAFYIFEQCMSFFEELFARYENVPLAFQGLYVNDIYWKLCTNILLPYHYEGEDYDRAIWRIRYLLSRCDNWVILNHPTMDFFEKYYLLRLKSEEALSYFVNRDSYGLMNDDVVVLREKSMEIVLTKFRIEDDKLIVYGFIKSVFLQFYDKEVMLCAVENGGRLTRKLKLYDSAHCYYMSREKTQKFQAFRYVADLKEVKSVWFEVGIGCMWFPTHYYFMPRIPFSRKLNRYEVFYQGYSLKCTEQNEIQFQKGLIESKDRIWLYYDCAGVSKDNGYLQFIHDVEMEDGIQRYYIVTDPRQNKDTRYEEQFVSFGSKRHKELLETCEKILTAYIEESNILPYTQNEIIKRADKLQFQVIYLQHGVLHIIMPWKFSPEKIWADKVVVSTQEEKELYLENGFAPEDILETGMARFDFLHKNSKKDKKILLALSWREYLVGDYIDHKWENMEKNFCASTYFLELQKFLSDPELELLLGDNGYQLELKLHPVFEQYKALFSWTDPYISFAPDQLKEDTYSLFITDFSSYLYNFLYMGTDIINFSPDITEFRSGMNGYRDLNYGEDFWGNLAYTAEDLTEKIRQYMNGEKSQFGYGHFLEISDCREALYREIID